MPARTPKRDVHVEARNYVENTRRICVRARMLSLFLG
jgi:hypothetical protein